MNEIIDKSTNGDDKKSDMQCLTFRLKNEVFGIEILRVKEILEYGGITQIPLVPNYIKGVLNLRGNVVPVIDLASRFGLEASSITKFSCVIIVEARSELETIDMGIVIDAVNEVISFRKDEIEAPPSFGTKIRTDFIHGMGKVDEKFIILLNVDRILDVEELALLQGITSKKENSEQQGLQQEEKVISEEATPTL